MNKNNFEAYENTYVRSFMRNERKKKKGKNPTYLLLQLFVKCFLSTERKQYAFTLKFPTHKNDFYYYYYHYYSLEFFTSV